MIEPKLTDDQREVLELLNNGWQIGVGSSMDGRVWIQKGGAGRGGESRQVSRTTYDHLLHNRLIAISKRSFPTSTYDITKGGVSLLEGNWSDEVSEAAQSILKGDQEPLILEEDHREPEVKEHPSYGMVSISHTTSSTGSALYGCSLKPTEVIRLNLHESSVEERFGQEHFRTGREIFSVELSYDQFVRMLFTPNRGEGTPCTIVRREGAGIEPPPHTSQREVMSKNFERLIARATDNAAILTAEAKRILGGPGSLKKDDKAFLLSLVERLLQDVRQNIPFAERQFQEQVDKVLTQASTQLQLQHGKEGDAPLKLMD